MLTSSRATLRELLPADVPALHAMFVDQDVRRFLSWAPTAERDLMALVRWARRARRTGRHLCFGVVPHGMDTVAGLFQIWPLEPSFETAEWGFALAPAFWGTGLFKACAEQIVDFAVDRMGVRRLEARAAVANVRGNAALKKMGAVREGILRDCFRCGGPPLDHAMWAILSADWRRGRGLRSKPAPRTGPSRTSRVRSENDEFCTHVVDVRPVSPCSREI